MPTRYDKPQPSLHGDQTRLEETFYRVEYVRLPLPKMFVARILMRDLFAVGNFVHCLKQ